MNVPSVFKYALLLSLVALLSCNSKKLETHAPQAIQANTLHIVINNSIDSLLRIKLRVGLNDTIQEQYVVSKRLDTLTIDLDRQRLLTLDSKAALGQSLVAKPGDSIVVDIVKGELSVRSTSENALIDLNASQLNVASSYLQDSLYAQLVQTDSSRGMAVSNDYSSMVLYPIFFQKDFNQEHPELIREFTRAAYAEANGLLNKVNREGQSGSIKKLSVKEEVQLNRIFRRISFLARQQKDEAYMTEFLSSQFFDDDFLMQSTYGVAYLFSYITEGVLNGDLKRTSNRNYIKYAKAYDLLENHFEEPLLARAKKFCLERMVSENESYETISTYATAYQNTYPEDTLFLSSFSENFLISREQLVKSKVGLNLLLENGSTEMLTGLLNELKGSVVYLDFWASWCAPCREAMPSSLRLKKKYAKEDVTFVYFSIDAGQDAWKRASKSDKIADYEHNYLVLNHNTSDFKKRLQLDAIPRYLIFDKGGKLVEKNAPSPMDSNLEEVLNRYIAN